MTSHVFGCIHTCGDVRCPSPCVSVFVVGFPCFCGFTVNWIRGPGHTGGPSAAQCYRVLTLREHLCTTIKKKYANDNKQTLPKPASSLQLHLRGEVKDTVWGALFSWISAPQTKNCQFLIIICKKSTIKALPCWYVSEVKAIKRLKRKCLLNICLYSLSNVFYVAPCWSVVWTAAHIFQIGVETKKGALFYVYYHWNVYWNTLCCQIRIK